MADVALSTATLNVLVELSRTRQLLNTTANRLVTGKRAASPLDNPENFFDAANLTDRATRLQPVKDDVSLALSSVNVAGAAIDAVDALVDQMKALALSAKSQTNAVAAAIAAQYDVLRAQINNLVSDASFNGKNFVKSSPDSLTVYLNVEQTTSMTVTGIATTVSDLSISSGVTTHNNFDTDTDVDNAVAELDAAILELRANTARFDGYSGILQSRLDFTESLIGLLEEGAAKLVNADLNAESATLIALQTRHDLALTTLGLRLGNSALFQALRLG